MVSIARSKNSVQAPEINKSVSAGFVNGGNVRKTIYTCPAGKVAIIKSFKTKMGALGANTYLDWEAKLVSLRHSTVSNDLLNVEIAGNGIRLTATQTLSYLGDAGANNADGSYDVAIQELSA